MSKATRHENIYTLPNILTASRLLAAPFIGYCILHDYHAAALGLFAYAGVTDALDGWIARRWNLGTVVGTVIDPMADKTLMTVLTVALAVKGALPGMLSFYPSPLFILLVFLFLTQSSLAGLHHPRPGRRSRHLSHLLPLDLAPSTKNTSTVLGFLAPFGRGASDTDQQGQHGAAAGPDGADDAGAGDSGGGYDGGFGGHAVSFTYLSKVSSLRGWVFRVNAWG